MVGCPLMRPADNVQYQLQTMGTIKDSIGSLTGNTQQQAEGKAQAKKGEAQKAANQ